MHSQRIRLWWENIHHSLWFLPLIFVVAGMGLSWLALHTPAESLRDSPVAGWLLHNAGAKHGHDLLANLLSSMITMTALVMSLTMVVLALAANNLGPRLIPFFMSSKTTQATHAMFIGTIIYLLMTLRVISEDMPAAEVPVVAITLGSLLVLLSLIMLIFFLHHLARSIVVDTVIRFVGDSLHQHMERYLARYCEGQQPEPLKLEQGFELTLACTGYVQAIDEPRLLALLEERNAQLNLTIRPGNYLLAGAKIGQLAPANLKEDETFLCRLRDMIKLGGEPTPLQDIEFEFRQLVEIALRALSPSLFDPFTAIRVIDKTSAVLQQAAGLNAGFYGASDSKGTLRLTLPISNLLRLLDLAYTQIRHAGANMPEVLIHLLKSFNALAYLSRDPTYMRTLHQHAELIMQAAEKNLPEPALIERVRKSFDLLCEAISNARPDLPDTVMR